jgi:hypothetical protein
MAGKHELDLNLLQQPGNMPGERSPETFNSDEINFLTDENVRKGVEITNDFFKDIDKEFAKASIN